MPPPTITVRLPKNPSLTVAARSEVHGCMPSRDRKGVVLSLRLELPHEIDDGAHMVHGRLRQNAMTQVEDVAGPRPRSS